MIAQSKTGFEISLVLDNNSLAVSKGIMPTTTTPFVIVGIGFLSNNALQVIVKGNSAQNSDFRNIQMLGRSKSFPTSLQE